MFLPPLSAALVLWAGLVVAGAAAAQDLQLSGPPQCAELPVPEASEPEAQAYFEHLQAQCLRSAAYYRQRGQWQLQHREFEAAVESLERSLLLEPEHPGTLLDYAQALLAVGDNSSARHILQALRSVPEMPLSVRGLLEAQLLALDGPAAAPRRSAAAVAAGGGGKGSEVGGGMVSRLQLSQAVGADSNLNNASTSGNITLTYPEADLTLPLAEDYRPHGGGGAITTLQWSGWLAQQQSLWVLQAEGRARHTADAAYRYQQVDLGAAWLQAPEAERQWMTQFGLSQLRWGGASLYRSLRAGVQHQWRRSLAGLDCRVSAGAEVEGRHYPVSPLLDGRYQGGTVALACLPQSGLSLQLRGGQDVPQQSGRVGGRQQQYELRLQWQFSAVGNQWQAEYAVQHYHDAQGYSPLLSHNARRRIERQTLRLEASRPLTWPEMGSPQWFANVELVQQRSNLQTFVSSRRFFQTGLRWLWL